MSPSDPRQRRAPHPTPAADARVRRLRNFVLVGGSAGAAALHGARVSYLGWTGPRNLTLAQRLDRHFAQFGAPSACVLLKYADDDALSACRRRGALVLLDCIDNFRCFGVSRAAHEYPKYDALLSLIHI